MDVINEQLQAAGGPYFLGPEISLVDITFVPMVERAAASLAYYKGCYVRGAGRWPAVDAWFNALETRSTYMGTKWVAGGCWWWWWWDGWWGGVWWWWGGGCCGGC
jgi:glutathione S-transferase